MCNTENFNVVISRRHLTASDSACGSRWGWRRCCSHQIFRCLQTPSLWRTDTNVYVVACGTLVADGDWGKRTAAVGAIADDGGAPRGEVGCRRGGSGDHHTLVVLSGHPTPFWGKTYFMYLSKKKQHCCIFSWEAFYTLCVCWLLCQIVTTIYKSAYAAYLQRKTPQICWKNADILSIFTHILQICSCVKDN